MVEGMRNTERELNREIEDLKTQMRIKDQELDRLKSRTDNASYYTKTLEQELADQRTEIQRLNDLLNSQKNDVVKSE